MKYLATIGILVLFAFNGTAQKLDSTLNFTNIDIPTSPGFALLDEAPSLINTPTSARAFTLSILNSVAESQGIPKDYAFEITPFWYYKHKALTSYKYWGITPEGKNRPFSSLWSNLSISAAYVSQQDSINNIAFGGRTTICKWLSKSEINAIIALTKKVNQKQHDILMQNINNDNPNAALKSFKDSTLKSQKSSSDSTLKSAESSLDSALAQKPIFAIDGAAAGNVTFMSTNPQNRRFDKSGVWVTLNLNIPFATGSKNYVSLYGIGRFLQDKDSTNAEGNYVTTNNLDVGGKFELQFDKLSISYEYIYRSSSGKTQSSSYWESGNIKYKITSSITIVGSIGQNFGGTADLFSKFGLEWGFLNGNEKVATR